MNKNLTLITDPDPGEHLTRGEEYKVIATNQDGSFVKIIDDYGKTVWKKRDCFY